MQSNEQDAKPHKKTNQVFAHWPFAFSTLALCFALFFFLDSADKSACLAQTNVRPPRPYKPTYTYATTILPFGIDYDRILREHPRDYISWYRRGQIKAHGADLTGALKDYAQSIKVNPLQSDLPTAKTPADQITIRAWAYQYSGEALCNLKRYKEGIKALSHAITLRPNFRSNYETRAAVYKKIGRTDLAEKDDRRVAYLKTSTLRDTCSRAPIRLALPEAPGGAEKQRAKQTAAD